MNLEELKQGLKSGRKIRIRGYVKPQNRYRLSDEVVDVEIDTQLPTYDILKRQSLNELKRKPLSEVIRIGKSKGASKEDSEKAYRELTESLSGGSSSSRFSGSEYESVAPYVNMNTDTGDIYFMGKKLKENVISSSTYKEKNSRPKTLVKNELRKNLPNNVSVWKVNVDDLDKVEFI